MNFKNISIFFITCLLFQASAHAAVYKCLDNNGKTSYKDKPCTSSQKNQKVKIDKIKSKDRVRTSAEIEKLDKAYQEEQDRQKRDSEHKKYMASFNTPKKVKRNRKAEKRRAKELKEKLQFQKELKESSKHFERNQQRLQRRLNREHYKRHNPQHNF